MIDRKAKIYVAGHKGLVGTAILNNLREKGFSNLILKTHAQLDLTDQQAVAQFFSEEKPEYVILAAAKVGGIAANNKYRAQFIYENLMIQNNVIHQSYLHDVKKLVFLGSTCIYPKNTKQPIPENELLTGPLEYTNEPYAIAKIAGMKMCESYNLQYGTNFISVMPTNLYGPGDNFNLETSHVLPAIMRKIHLAHCLEQEDWEAIIQDLNAYTQDIIEDNATPDEIKNRLSALGISYNKSRVQVEIWGSGDPRREFLWSEDMADATVFIMESVDFGSLAETGKEEIRNTHINIGTGKEVSIKKLTFLIAKAIGFKGELWFNQEKPDGTMRKLTDVTKLQKLGWKHEIEIEEGIDKLYKWYLDR